MNINTINIKKLISKGETAVIEFKEQFNEAVIETLCAFANTKGGHVLVGVDDKKHIKGILPSQIVLSQWINEIKTKTSPSLFPDVETKEINGKQIVIFFIQQYPIKPVSCKGRYYKRVGNSNHQMNIDEVVNLHLKTINISWDYYIDSVHTIDDISLDKVNHFISFANTYRETPITDDPLTVLRKYELQREQGISLGCFLLFMKNESYLTTIELGRFQADTLIKDAVKIQSDLFSQVEGVLVFIRKHINKAYIITGNAQRTERWEYPMDAIREIVVNMISHRDYSLPSDSVIKIFDDRIEFYNPGKLSEGLTVEKLLSGDYVSTIRNKQIASVFKEANIIEKYGTGIRRIINAFRNYGLKLPEFKDVPKGFKVVVYAAENKKQYVPENVPRKQAMSQEMSLKTSDVPKNVPRKQRMSQEMSLKNSNDVPRNVPKKSTNVPKTKELDIQQNRLNNIVVIIKGNKYMTIQELSSALKVAEKTIKRDIILLKKQKILKRIGPKKGGWWKIVK